MPNTRNRLLVYGSFIGFFSLLVSSSCLSDEIQIDKIMLERMKESQVQKEVDARNQVCRKLPFVGGKDCLRLNLSDIRASGGDVRYSSVKPASIPETITTESYIFRNCSSSERQDSKTVAITYTEGNSITKVDRLSSQSSINAGLQIKALQLGMSESKTVSFSNTEVNNYTKTVTETIQLNEKIKPYTALTVNIEKRTSNAYLDFDGDINLDGKLTSHPCCGWRGDSIYLGRYRDLVSDKRPITVRGKIWNAKAMSTTKSYYEKQLDKDDPNDCPPPPGLVAFKSNKSTPEIALDAKALSSLSTNDLNSLKGNTISEVTVIDPSFVSSITPKTVVPFVNGMSISTSNSISTVEVRAKSFGPGFCGVRFNTMGGTTQFLAPPLLWGEWMQLTVHMGEVNYTITNEVLCDTGVVAEVRYQKK